MPKKVDLKDVLQRFDKAVTVKEKEESEKGLGAPQSPKRQAGRQEFEPRTSDGRSRAWSASNRVQDDQSSHHRTWTRSTSRIGSNFKHAVGFCHPGSQQPPSTPIDKQHTPLPAKDPTYSVDHPRQGRADHLASSSTDTRPIILFCLNGTLTFRPRNSREHVPRPEILQLRRLEDKFRLGIFSSAMPVNVDRALLMIEEAAGEGPKLFSDRCLILCRGATQLASTAERRSWGGKEWDTKKPLHLYFSNESLKRVLRVDEDASKALPGERDNVILIPSWTGARDDKCLIYLVDAILDLVEGFNELTDFRKFTKAISGLVFSAHDKEP